MKKASIFLLVIIFVATFLRLYQIDTNPIALYGDSLTGVYDAYSILKTGHDQKGEFMPLVFSLGGGRPGGYIYATVPFVALFGPTALSSRMVSVLSGIGIVFLLYLLGKRFFSEGIGLAIAAVAAINPWELSLSRGPFETHFALFLTLFGFYSFIKGLKQKYWFIAFGLSLGLAMHTYSTYKLIIPLFVVILFLWIGKKTLLENFRKPVFIFSLIVIFVLAVLGVYLTISRGSQDRFDIINIFNDPSLRSTISQKVEADRLLDNPSPVIAKYLHNNQMEIAAVLAENYVQSFFPSFLFLHGDGQVRHNPAEMGEFYWIDLLFLVLGIVYLYGANKRILLLLSGWILIAPIATSLVGGPHALRSSFLLTPLLVLIGLGLWKLWTLRTKPFTSIIFTIIAIVFFFQFIIFIDHFYFIAPKKHERFWSYPAKEAYTLAAENRQKFDSIILSNDIDNMEFAYPVYAKLDPNLVIKQNQNPAKIGEFKFFKYDNVYIGSLPNSRVMQFIKDLPGSVLYVGAEKEQPFLENYTIIRGFDNQADLIVVPKP